MIDIRQLIWGFEGSFENGPLTLNCDVGIHHLQGANGSGKTTLFRVLCNEIMPLSGSFSIAGHSRGIELRKRVSFVPASPDIPGFLTAGQAVAFVAGLREARSWPAKDLADELGISLNQTMATASSGQARKIQLLSSLAGEPPVLLLDETFAHLDTQSAAVLVRWLEKRRSSHCIVISGHGDLPITPDTKVAV